jgi:hypothetical protein
MYDISITAALVSVLVMVLNSTDTGSKILFMETHGKIWCASKKWKEMYYSITFLLPQPALRTVLIN